MKQRLGGGMFVYIIVLIVGFSLFLVNGNSNIVGPHGDAPHAFTQAIPKQTSGAHGIGSVNDQTNLQVGQFDFVTVTPVPVTPGPDDGWSFVSTHDPLDKQADYDAEKQDYITNHGFTQSSTTIDGTPAVEVSGTMPTAVINGKNLQGPAQLHVIYLTHGDQVWKITFSYIGARLDLIKELVFLNMLADFHFT